MNNVSSVAGPVKAGNSLSDMNNEAVIQLLGLNGSQQVERSRLLDDIVTYLNLDSFTEQCTVEPLVEPAAGFGVNSSTQGAGHHRVIGQGPGHHRVIGQGPGHHRAIGQGPGHHRVIGQGQGHHRVIAGTSPGAGFGSTSPGAGYGSTSPGAGFGGTSPGAGYEAPVPNVISYVDFSPPQVENSSNYVPIIYSTQEVSACAPTSSVEKSEISYQALTSSGSHYEVSSPVLPVANHKPRKHASGKAPRPRKREPTVKLYECEEPLSDPEEEKKRVNAINAKKNRDKRKKRMQELERLVASLTAERDSLQTNNDKLINKCDIFGKKLMSVCQQLNVPVIILPQD